MSDATPNPHVVSMLVDNHRAFLRFLERRVGDRETAEDLLQDAFVKALNRLPAIRNDESAVAWFYRVLRNAVIDNYRRRATASKATERLASEIDEAVPDQKVRGEICRCVVRLAAALKPEYAEALRAIDVDGRSVKDFAATRGLSARNAAVRVFRARQALRRRVVQSCGSCAEHGCCLDCSCGTRARQP